MGDDMPINLADSQLRDDPYSLYAHMRKHEPIARVEDSSNYAGRYFLTRYDDISAVLKDPRFSSDMRNRQTKPSNSLLNSRWFPSIFKAFEDSMVMVDDPHHRRLRDLVHKAFTPKRIEDMTQRVDALCDELLDAAAAKPTTDLIADFALPLPLTIISELMGVPPQDRMKFRRWTGGILQFTSKWKIIREIPNAIAMFGYLKKLIKMRKVDPQDDLTTALVQANVNDDRLTEDEMLGMLFLLLFAGHETTVNLIGNGMLALMEHRDQFDLLHAQPQLIDTAVEELLRYGNPVEQVAPRWATEDIEINGHCFPKGSIIAVALPSANRDEAVFENPDDLDITRSPNRHIGFGLGVHYCLGAPLARLEGRIAIQKLVQRFPSMQLAVPFEALRWKSTVGVRGLESLPLKLNG